VAAGGDGSIFTSPDGNTWTNHTSRTTGWLQGVAYGNGQFVVVGEQGPAPSDDATIVTSPDGLTWSDRSPPTAYPSAVAYGNGRFVAVGINGAILTSFDGINWSSTTSAPAEDLHGITYGNHQFVAVGFDERNETGAALSSPNGVTWTRHAGTTNNLSAITYGNGQFVAVGGSAYYYYPNSHSTILASPDGNTWTSRNPGTTNTLEGIIYGNNLFVAVGSDSTVLTSVDGMTWTQQTSSALQYVDNFGGIAYGNGQFVAVGWSYLPSFGPIVTSPDGVHWTHRLTLFPALHGVAFGNNTFIAVGDDGAILQSGVLTQTQPSLGPLVLLSRGAVQLKVTGAGQPFSIQTSVSFLDWLALTNVVSTNDSVVLIDSSAANVRQRFYRAVVP
jgi:hypothetical protein